MASRMSQDLTGDGDDAARCSVVDGRDPVGLSGLGVGVRAPAADWAGLCGEVSRDN